MQKKRQEKQRLLFHKKASASTCTNVHYKLQAKNTGIKIWKNNPPVSYNIYNEMGEFFTALPTWWNHFVHKRDKTSLRCLQKQKVDEI